MLRRFLILIVLVLGLMNNGYCQSLTVNDLINIAKLSHEQATKYLTTDKYFTSLSPISVHNITISQFERDTTGISEIVIKSEWEDQGRKIPSVHYEIKPKSYASTIMKQLEISDFKLIDKEDDDQKHVRLYDNGSFMISIHTFEFEKLGASIEVHGK